MPAPIVSVGQEAMKEDLRGLVRRTVEDTLNGPLEEEADDLVGADRYERAAGREAHRAGHYDRNLTTTSGNVGLHMPELKGARFTTAIIERYRRRETSVEEAMIEMYPAGVPAGRIGDVSGALWGASVSAATAPNLNERAFASVEERGNRPLARACPYVFVDGIYLRRAWGGAHGNAAAMVAIGADDDGHREAIGAAEGFTVAPGAGESSSRGRGPAACGASGCSRATRPPAWRARSPRRSPRPPTSAARCTSTATCSPGSRGRGGARSPPCSGRSAPWSRERPARR